MSAPSLTIGVEAIDRRIATYRELLVDASAAAKAHAAEPGGTYIDTDLRFYQGAIHALCGLLEAYAPRPEHPAPIEKVAP
jgi:hypothetical protein